MMSKSQINSIEALEEALDNGYLNKESDSLGVIAPFWNKSLSLNQKIETFLRQESLVEEFIDLVGIERKKKSSQILETETLTLSSKTEKAQSLMKTTIEVDVVLKKGSLTEFEEVEYQSNLSFVSNSMKTAVGVGLAVMLMGPLLKVNIQQLSHAAIPSKSWNIVPEQKFKDPIVSENIREVLQELSQFNDPQIDDIAKHIIGLNLEDVGGESEEDFSQLDAIEREATVEKIEALINSYYSYKKDNTRALAEKIFDQSKEKSLDYHILLGIIKTESDFNQDAVSSTGDLSMVQINYRIWSREYLRRQLLEDIVKVSDLRKATQDLKNEDPKKQQFNVAREEYRKLQKVQKINEKIIEGQGLSKEELSLYTEVTTKHGLLNVFKLKSDSDYSIEKMAEILSILKETHSKDKNWFARYHSSSFDRKMGYANKVKNNISHMDKVNKSYLQEQIGLIKLKLSKAVDSHGIDSVKVSKLNESLSRVLRDNDVSNYIAKN